MYKDYNINQLVLPMNLEIQIKENDIALDINNLVESIPQKTFSKYIKTTGCPSYHPRMLLKIILCAYCQSVFSGRKMENMITDSIRMMWLAQGYTPSYRTINRFRSNPQMQEVLRECFVQFRAKLVEEKIIAQEAVFIDGTKIEANANKFTFVWKKSVVRHNRSAIEKSMEIYETLMREKVIPVIELENSEEVSEAESEIIAEKIDETVAAIDEAVKKADSAADRKRLRRKRKPLKEAAKRLRDCAKRRRIYKKHLEVMGKRNSYSKTDEDATFMRMKEDYMKNGQLKAGYNVQIATECQYALAYELYPNPTDTKTFIPFLETIEKEYFPIPKYIVADAGYGSEENYKEVLERRGKVALITYNRYIKEQSRKYKKDIFNRDNWVYDNEEDSYTCPGGRKVVLIKRRNSKNGKGLKVYECEECRGCPQRNSCTKAEEGKNRTLQVNPQWEMQKEYVRKQLSEKNAGEIYRRRKIDVEPVFGFLKANLHFTRYNLRGMRKAKIETGLALMAVNLRKYAKAVA